MNGAVFLASSCVGARGKGRAAMSSMMSLLGIAVVLVGLAARFNPSWW